MKKKNLKNIISKLIIWVLLIQMVNISLDPVDKLQPINRMGLEGEDLTINEIESVYELISERVFKSEIPESDENDEDAFTKIFSVCFNKINASEYLNQFTFKWSIKVFYTHFSSRIYYNSIEIDSPPPRFA